MVDLSQIPYITRHDIGESEHFVRELLDGDERLFDEAVRYAARRPVNVWHMFRYSRAALAWRAVLSPEDQRLQTHLLHVARSAAAYAKMIQPGAGEVELDLGDGRQLQLPHASQEAFTPAGLTSAIYAAIIARDTTALNDLCRVDVRSLQAPGSVNDEYAFAWAEYLQALMTRSPEADKKLEEAILLADPARLQTGNVDYALYVAFGEMDTFYGANMRDPNAFTEKLVKALERHKRFYGSIEVNPGESQRSSPQGMIALGLLAACALLYDHGRPVRVGSDYLPPALIEGRLARS